MLAKVFLCGAPFLQEIYGQHPLFSEHSVFKDKAYPMWRKIVKAHVQIMESLEETTRKTSINLLSSCTFEVNESSNGCIVTAVGQVGTLDRTTEYANKLSQIANVDSNNQVSLVHCNTFHLSVHIHFHNCLCLGIDRVGRCCKGY